MAAAVLALAEVVLVEAVMAAGSGEWRWRWRRLKQVTQAAIQMCDHRIKIVPK